MATVTKEKNLYNVLLEGKTKPYVLDINTGIIYGLRGNPIKSIPHEVYQSFDRKTNVGMVIEEIRYWCMGNLTQYSDILQIADSFDNLGIKLCGASHNFCDNAKALAKNKKLCKEYIKYAQERTKNGDEYSFFSFQLMKEKLMVSAKFGFNIDSPEYEHIYNYLKYIAQWATARQIQCFKVNFIDNNLYHTFRREQWRNQRYIDDFKTYCECCEYLEEKVTTKPNFFSEYGRIYKAYLAQKEHIDTFNFQKAINMHRKEMEFKYGNYVVVIPETPQDIKDEGKNMHHCVASYAKDCIKFDNPNRSYIVFVRHKDTPEKCYITCQINNGRIGQYYLSRDRHIYEDEDIEFRRKYQEHLNTHWVKE